MFLVRIFTSRKVWIALAALAGTLLTVFKMDPEKWTPVITAIVTLAGVVIAAIGFEDGSEKSSAAGPPGVPGDVFKPLLMLPLLATLALACGGCSTIEGLFTSPSAVQASAHREIYSAIEPEYRAYVVGDIAYTEQEKALRMRTLERWDDLIRSMERRATGAPETPLQPIGAER